MSEKTVDNKNMDNNQNNQKHRHFQLTEKDAGHLLRHPGKIAFLSAVGVTIILCVLFVYRFANYPLRGDLILPSNNSLSESENKISNPTKDEYENKIKIIINNYLDAKKISSDNTSCQKKVGQTVNEILNLVVPLEMKTFHLRLVVLLDRDNQLCLATSNEFLNQKNINDWNLFLEEYNWLK